MLGGGRLSRCLGDWLEVRDQQENSRVARLVPRSPTVPLTMLRFCGSSVPAEHTSSSHSVTLHAVTSTNSTGDLATLQPPGGWRLLFQILPEVPAAGASPTGGLPPSTLT